MLFKNTNSVSNTAVQNFLTCRRILNHACLGNLFRIFYISQPECWRQFKLMINIHFHTGKILPIWIVSIRLLLHEYRMIMSISWSHFSYIILLAMQITLHAQSTWIFLSWKVDPLNSSSSLIALYVYHDFVTHFKINIIKSQSSELLIEWTPLWNFLTSLYATINPWTREINTQVLTSQ